MDDRVLLLVHAPHVRALAFLRDVGAGGAVGPTSTSGWTAAWLSEGTEESHVRPAEAFALLSEHAHGLFVTVREGADAPLVERITVDEASARDLAHQLAELLGLRGQADAAQLADILVGDPDLDGLVSALGEVLEVPPVGPPVTEVSVVVTQCALPHVRLVARVDGSLRIGSADGWRVLTPVGPPRDLADTAWSVAEVASRHDSTVHLWKRGAHHGFWARRGRYEAAWHWGDPWRSVDDLPHEPSAAVLAVERITDRRLPPDERRRLLAVLHRPGDEPLTEVVRLLGLPADVEAIVDGAAARMPLPEEIVEAAPVAQGVLLAMVESYRSPPPLRASTRWAYALLTAATFAMTLVSALMGVLSVGVLATDGEYVDQHGTGPEDWAFAALAVLTTAALVLASRYRWRRLRGRIGSRTAGHAGSR